MCGAVLAPVTWFVAIPPYWIRSNFAVADRGFRNMPSPTLLVLAGQVPQWIKSLSWVTCRELSNTHNNDVAPNIHRLRVLGGPIFNVIGLLLSIAIYEIFLNHPMARELIAWSAVGHGLLLIMSLYPWPIVDRGTILKWTLVVGGRTEALADRIVRRVDWVIGSMLILFGIGLLSIQLWIVGFILIGLGIVVLEVTAGKIQ